ncbi:hypothetical protein ACIBF7_02850 [Nonomuraea sp. NPDC050478]|uniref:hypothetical protein n=1 Tax=Nonomuraea sp. NPDC050478 TaxID=3364365 RepID=UPI0037B9DEBA
MAMTASEMVLAGLSAVVVVAVVGWRGLVRARLRAEVRSRRAALRSRSGTARYFFDRERGRWRPELDAAMAGKLEELDRREAEVGALAAGDPGLGDVASRLGGDYESFGNLVRALSECEAAASGPHPDIDELLPERASSEAVAALRSRWDGLEERRVRLVHRIRDSSPDAWAKLASSATSLGADCMRLTADVTRAWERMFPDRAAARAAEEQAVFEHILDDIARRGRATTRRPDRSRGHVSDAGPYDDQG